MTKEKEWLRQNGADDSIRNALTRGWEPSRVYDGTDLWRERILCNPDEYMEEIVDDLINHLSFEERMERLLSFYSAEANSFLQEDETPIVEAMFWLEERNQSGQFLNRHYLQVRGEKPKDCGREIVRMIHVTGAIKIRAKPSKVEGASGEYTDTLFVEFPSNQKQKMVLWAYISNLHPKEVALESEEPVVVRVTF
jgi:hypothetical protein